MSSTAVVQNGDEFVRNIDLAVDLVSDLSEKYGLDKTFGKVGEFLNKFYDLLGI